jgi:LysM repeat protein
MDMVRNRNERARDIQRSRVASLEWAALVLVLVVVVGGAAAGGIKPTPEFSTTTIKTRSGDTLWELAGQHPVKGLTTGETTALIAEINDLSEGTLASGTTVIVPSEDGGPQLAMR